MARTSEPKRSVCLALGANMGDRIENLRTALARLACAGPVIAVSALYRTSPVGVTDQPDFLNAACRLQTELPLDELLALVKQIEWELGRRPARFWGPRPLDIDLILAGSETVTTPDLVVPHPSIAERAFVLVPLAEIAGEQRHPVLGQDVRSLLASLPKEELDAVVRLRGPEWASNAG